MVRYLSAVFGVLLGGSSILPVAASAQVMMSCGQHNDVTTALKKVYSETPVAIGLSNNGHMVEVFAAATGSWTIVMTSPAGYSCVIGAGQAWEAVPKATAGTAM